MKNKKLFKFISIILVVVMFLNIIPQGVFAFAAEEARLSRKIIDVDEYIEEIKAKAKAKMAKE